MGMAVAMSEQRFVLGFRRVTAAGLANTTASPRCHALIAGCTCIDPPTKPHRTAGMQSWVCQALPFRDARS
jgi:hypothetical protein